ncbi:MAG TPA: DUF917 domain-containing protein [Trueperaceae bacterium]|nr:DUF917 domain-containing protein [Trueperaceae bacterium]
MSPERVSTGRARRLGEADVDAIAVGAAILGTGGGGNPYIGSLRAKEQLRAGGVIDVVGLEDLAPDAMVVSVGGIGAPVVGIEKIEKGDECLEALRGLEDYLGRKVDAVVAAEIGGSNSIEPMITAAQAGIPVVDADGMGRAFPEVQMCTYFIYGHEPAPAAMADEKGNRVLFTRVKDMYWLERLARTTAVDMGAAAGFALAPMRGDFLQRYAVPRTLTQCLELGHTVAQARRERRNVVEAVRTSQGGVRLFDGKIADVRRELKGGFAVGRVRLDGIDADAGAQAEIDIQNENLVFRRGGVVEASVPDLIIVLDADTGLSITTEVLRFGLRVSVLALPCHPLLRTPEALEVIGPAAFGYPDVTYRPLAAEGSPHATVPR